MVVYPDVLWDLAECGWHLAEWLERLTANAKVATFLGSIPASSDTGEIEGRQTKQCWWKYFQNSPKNPPESSGIYLWAARDEACHGPPLCGVCVDRNNLRNDLQKWGSFIPMCDTFIPIRALGLTPPPPPPPPNDERTWRER